MKKYLIALDRHAKNWCCQTILVKAKDEDDAYAIAMHLKPNHIGGFGMIKEVNY